ncbi:MAG TPA: reverse transcriptase domain-containing protein [Rubrobacteraceae bacterium]|nr:reverse transcriptase domain-containing protein [Rubrobacteraceae bacterium]
MSAIIKTQRNFATKAEERQRRVTIAVGNDGKPGELETLMPGLGEREGETRLVRAMKVRAVPTPLSPVISNLVLDGLEQVACGSSRFRRRHHLNYVRWADDFIVTANSREVLEEVVLPRINAFLAERGVWLSTEKTVITPHLGGF